MKKETIVTLVILTIAAPASAELRLPAGWEAGVAVTPAEAPGDPACCKLGGGHPCCAHQRSFDASKPHRIEELVEIDVATLPVVALEGCASVPDDAPLPAAESEARDFGLGVYVQGTGGRLITQKRGADIRLRPLGKVGGIRAENVGFWSPGATGNFSDKGSFSDYGIAYQYGAPWGRLGRLTFNSVLEKDDGLRYRFFDGSYDAITGKVGKRCHYEAPLTPLLDHWIYGFVGERDGERELHIVMPDGDILLFGGRETSTAFDPLFSHRVMALDGSSTAATRTSTFEWEHLQDDIPDMFFRGVISVHVTPTSVLVAKEHKRG